MVGLLFLNWEKLQEFCALSAGLTLPNNHAYTRGKRRCKEAPLNNSRLFLLKGGYRHAFVPGFFCSSLSAMCCRVVIIFLLLSIAARAIGQQHWARWLYCGLSYAWQRSAGIRHAWASPQHQTFPGHELQISCLPS